MDWRKAQVMQWGRRIRDFLFGYDLKSNIAELPTLRQELDDALEQLTSGAAAQDAITRQARVQTTEIKRLRQTLREKHLKPIVRMSRTMTLEITDPEITFALPHPKAVSERLATAADGMVTALKTVGPQFIARGFTSNFVEQLSTATKALRDAIDQRAAHVSRRIGTTAAMERDATRVVQLVRVIDTLVRPVIERDPEVLAAWENVMALPQPRGAGGAVAAPPAPSATAGPVTPSGETAHGQQVAA
jgi:hypothetical protein